MANKWGNSDWLYFQIRLHSDILGVKTSTYECWWRRGPSSTRNAQSSVQYTSDTLNWKVMYFWRASSVQFSRSVVSNSLRPHEPSTPGLLSITNSRSLPKPMSIELVMPSNHLILCCPLFLLPSIFPTSGSFQMSQLSTSGGQSIRISASTSVLPMNTQDWSALGWTGWISLQSKGLSRVFSNTTVQKHQFFGAQLSL